MDLLIVLTYVAFAWAIFKNIPYSGKSMGRLLPPH